MQKLKTSPEEWYKYSIIDMFMLQEQVFNHTISVYYNVVTYFDMYWCFGPV